MYHLENCWNACKQQKNSNGKRPNHFQKMAVCRRNESAIKIPLNHANRLGIKHPPQSLAVERKIGQAGVARATRRDGTTRCRQDCCRAARPCSRHCSRLCSRRYSHHCARSPCPPGDADQHQSRQHSVRKRRHRFQPRAG